MRIASHHLVSPALALLDLATVPLILYLFSDMLNASLLPALAAIAGILIYLFMVGLLVNPDSLKGVAFGTLAALVPASPLLIYASIALGWPVGLLLLIGAGHMFLGAWRYARS